MKVCDIEWNILPVGISVESDHAGGKAEHASNDVPHDLDVSDRIFSQVTQDKQWCWMTDCWYMICIILGEAK